MVALSVISHNCGQNTKSKQIGVHLDASVSGCSDFRRPTNPVVETTMERDEHENVLVWQVTCSTGATETFLIICRRERSSLFVAILHDMRRTFSKNEFNLATLCVSIENRLVE